MAPDDGNAAAAGHWKPVPALIERYRDIARLSHDMLAAARREDWNEVARLAADCSSLIERLKRAALVEPLDEAEQQHRLELLREILRDDAQIRIRAEPWLAELEQLMGLTRSDGRSD
ncbi:MAG: flagellar protein FliT [Burkholderiaceae bacterium]|nr:flagellar protein FliT [Burkholderiaceae bacterium]